MDGLYSRVSSERQTTENQFEDVLQVAEKDGYGRDWGQIREVLSRCVIEEHRPGTTGTARTVYRVDSEQAAELARQCLPLFFGGQTIDDLASILLGWCLPSQWKNLD